MSRGKFVKRGRPPKDDLKPGSLGARIREARDDLGLTSRAAGARVGISHAALIQIERGDTHPDKTTLIRLAQELRSSFGEQWLKPYVKRSTAKNLSPLASELLRCFNLLPGNRQRALVDVALEFVESESPTPAATREVPGERAG